MKIFLSWSGERSKAVATALRDWLPNVIQSITPWMSAQDIDAGKRWSGEIAEQLKATKFGIICVTPENLSAPWILFESGALAKTVEDSNVVPYLSGMAMAELTGPLSQFQAKLADKKGTSEILCTINGLMGERALSEGRLIRAFERWWSQLEENLKAIPPPLKDAETPIRSEKDMIEELLELMRNMARVQEANEKRQFLMFTKLASRLEQPVIGLPRDPGTLIQARAPQHRLTATDQRDLNEAFGSSKRRMTRADFRKLVDEIAKKRIDSSVEDGAPQDDKDDGEQDK